MNYVMSIMWPCSDGWDLHSINYRDRQWIDDNDWYYLNDKDLHQTDDKYRHSSNDRDRHCIELAMTDIDTV